MFTSVIKKLSFPAKWLIISFLCLIFSIIYESFSHGVYSPFMVFLSLIPFLFGFIPCILLKKVKKPMHSRAWQDGVLLLLFGSLLQGIFDIYGTDSPFVKYYFYAGLIMLVIGIYGYIKK